MTDTLPHFLLQQLHAELLQTYPTLCCTVSRIGILPRAYLTCDHLQGSNFMGILDVLPDCLQLQIGAEILTFYWVDPEWLVALGRACAQHCPALCAAP